MSNKDSFSQFLIESSHSGNSILSVGYDPSPVEFPIEAFSGYDTNLPDPMNDYNSEEVSDTIVEYFVEFLDQLQKSDQGVGAFKPNLGYFRMYDQLDEFPGSKALSRILRKIDGFGEIPVILDVKDADIARSSAAYAISKLKFDSVDAITVHPFMGTDSVEPFFQLAHSQGKGVYVLTRTTNPGAKDFQDLTVEQSDEGSKKLYMAVAEKIASWSKSYPGTVGSVVAGNNPSELRNIVQFYSEHGQEIPLLIPGVGTQGGEVGEVMQVLEETEFDPRLTRINSSSGVTYRAQKDGRSRDQHAIASIEEIARLNEKIALESFIES